MNTFLIITQNAKTQWLLSTKKLIENLGRVEIRPPDIQCGDISSNRYSLILIDSAGIDDITSLISVLRVCRPTTPILVAMLARRWRWARDVLRAGATDCILKSSSTEKLLKAIISSSNAALPQHTVLPQTSIRIHNPGAGVILFADNDQDFLLTRGEFLEQAGYTVVKATTVLDAQQKLTAEGIDLAIIDIRLENDDDDKDLSGLLLAQKYARTTPKIMLTSYPTFEYVRDTLRPPMDGHTAAVDFLAKKDGPNVLLAAIRDILCMISKQQTGKTETKVFIAHGHDWNTRNNVANYLKKIGIQPLMLFDEADRGETIIDKLERCCREADFAIVLMTPDDIGFPKERPNEVRPRARQNVIFELGYLVARLGRRRVRVLYRDVEIPTNFMGVLYIESDTGGKWKKHLARELKDAGIALNNKVLV